MSEPELQLDPAIRIWVFLPIVLITFLFGIIRHYVSVLISSPKKVDLAQVTDSQLLIRARMLRENGRYLCKQSFLMRKNYMNHEETGMLKRGTQRATPPPNPMMDPSMMTEMLKGNLTSMVPMVVVGGWINWHFSGFVTTKVPFPLTLRFKGMLQRGIELQSLDASWVSSASWYFLNVFGLRSIYSLVLGENNAADQVRAMQESMSMQAGGMPPDSKAAFKAEWEALEVTEHTWALKNSDQEMMALVEPTPEHLYHQK
jgi:hypothetical protein